MLYSNTEHYWIISSKLLWNKFWNDTKWIFHEQNFFLIKGLAEKGFSVFRGINETPPNTLKLVLAKCSINFSHHSRKIYILTMFYTKMLSYYIIMFSFYCKAINNDGNKLFFYVNPKTRFLDVQKITKNPPKKYLQKKNSWVNWL